ncbi:steroid 17-alpha-hydroxylase/17,20 lyase-like [Diadema setosum]|uniref:steroid 17-alpha-hydroxylase/17,20 lyase-like n=1 Tax=Diadema setosum TaxID=31175 RepID=UPI003B3A2200
MLDAVGAVETTFGQVNSVMVTAVLGVIVTVLALRTIVRPKGFPPGPRGLPVVGSIYDMTDRPDIIFDKWAKKYGDVFGFKAGERWMVVLNRKDAIKEAILKQGAEFANRPWFYSVEIFSEGFKDIVFGFYSDTWKLHRKLAHTALRQFATGKRLDGLLHSVFPKFERALEENNGRPVDPKLMITLLLYNMLSTMCFGKVYEFKDPRLEKWREVIERATDQIGYGLAADFFAFARYVPTAGPRLLRESSEEILSIIRPEVENHKKTFNPDKVNDLIDLLLAAKKEAEDENSPDVDKLTDTHLVHTVLDMFSAGINTSTETLYWAMAIMAEHPDIQTKVRQEIDDVIGRDHLPEIGDRGSLPYAEATLYEIMRYSSLLPIALPHSTMKDATLHGYRIPKDTIVFINTYSMHYDPKEWDDPESFKPEHFLDNSGMVRQHPPSFLPFGAGRRSCLGEAVAKADLFIIFTWLMQKYTFSKVPGKERDNLLKVTAAPTARFLSEYQIVIKKRD